MAEIISALGTHMGLAVVSMLLAVVMVVALLKAVTRMFVTHAREKSRREIAAYIAEGSITPEQGERLMRADVNAGRNDDEA